MNMECFSSPFVAAFGRGCIPNKEMGNTFSSSMFSKVMDNTNLPLNTITKLSSLAQTDSENSSSSSSSDHSIHLNIPKSSLKDVMKARSIDDVDIVKTIGSGRFGFIHICQCKMTKSFAYLNIYQKSTLAETCQQHIPSRERDIIISLSHPFVAKCLGTFQNSSCLYMMLDLPRGGDLSRLLMSSSAYSNVPQKPLTEKQKMFYASCVLSVFKYIHAKSIIYRGLHPDTILIDEQGYIKLVDWGFAKSVSECTFTFCGHVEYLCPEAIVYDSGYGKGADYWALGILVYEMLAGRSAFVSTVTTTNEMSSTLTSDVDDTQTVENIITKDIIFPSYFSEDACSLISGLCEKNPTLRLGCLKNGRGITDIMSHPCFAHTDWDKLESRQVSPPWIPQRDSIVSLKYFAGDYVQEEVEQSFTGYNHVEWNSFA